ncbi:MAG: oligosaccharide flippase family protein, partial [Acutalibacteraceae bacterium]|nr:oligosaccharide flippase family protein [Acutalibacteraceae bacterium]
MQTGKFIKNAAVLTVTALILRGIGMVFRVWLSGAVGAEGMGLYQLILSVYMLAATFATSGISTAVTRLIAEELEVGTARSVRRILFRSVCLTLVIAAASTAAVFFGADLIAEFFIKDMRAALSLKILAFSLPFMGISSCIRGYFIALRRVAVQSSAQVFEQLIRIGVIMVIIGRFAPYGIGYASAAVLIGDTVAEALSCLFMFIGYNVSRRNIKAAKCGRKSPPYSVTGRIAAISLPITA